MLKQRSYTGRKPVISSTLANTPCADLTVRELLKNFNTILRTSYTLFTPWVDSILGDVISKHYDFGTAYAYLRPFWYSGLATVVDTLSERRVQGEKMWQDVLVDDRIVDTEMPPRRVWDLYSNRVVPWWVHRLGNDLWGISHAWMDEKDCKDVLTPINGREWPVPIPKDMSLDRIRIEMLNLRAEYVLLDMLCLRQEGRIREDLHVEEWKLDVPTIGSVYDGFFNHTVVCYLSRLGRSLGSNADDLMNDRCWFRRAWTLQENHRNTIIGGDTGDKKLRAKFEQQVSSLWGRRHLYDVL